MWYIFPSLREIRPIVIYPIFLLPTIFSAWLFLQDGKLRERLIEISNAATYHLKNGVDPSILFGHQHKYDAPKFHEVMSCFYLIAEKDGDRELFNCCKEGLEAFHVYFSKLPLIHKKTEEIFKSSF